MKDMHGPRLSLGGSLNTGIRRVIYQLELAGAHCRTSTARGTWTRLLHGSEAGLINLRLGPARVPACLRPCPPDALPASGSIQAGTAVKFAKGHRVWSAPNRGDDFKPRARMPNEGGFRQLRNALHSPWPCDIRMTRTVRVPTESPVRPISHCVSPCRRFIMSRGSPPPPRHGLSQPR